MKTAHVIIRRTALHHRVWCGVFAEGLRRHGLQVTVGDGWRAADLLVQWGVRRWQPIHAQRRIGGEVCILERGYVGDRLEWTSVSFGGELNGRAAFRHPAGDPSRWLAHFRGQMKPWARGSGPVVILGQVPGDASLCGIGNPSALYAAWAQALRRQGHDVMFRPHPLAAELRVPAVDLLDPAVPLVEQIRGASFVIAWNSNATVEAVLAGVPAVTMDRGAMAWPVTGHEIAAPPAPPREAWAADLAWKQWSAAEMSSGACWDVVGKSPGVSPALSASCAEVPA